MKTNDLPVNEGIQFTDRNEKSISVNEPMRFRIGNNWVPGTIIKFKVIEGEQYVVALLDGSDKTKMFHTIDVEKLKGKVTEKVKKEIPVVNDKIESEKPIVISSDIPEISDQSVIKKVKLPVEKKIKGSDKTKKTVKVKKVKVEKPIKVVTEKVKSNKVKKVKEHKTIGVKTQYSIEDVLAFNELRSCSDLLRMYKDNQLNIKPDFQREVVWSNIMQTRFIDSLIRQFPIPSLCFSVDYQTDNRLVIDGLQRIESIIKFLDVDAGKWHLSELDDIDIRISGKSNKTIKEENPELFNKVQNTVLPVTSLRCDFTKKDHMQYLFKIFHRLNTGGSKLSNQEIRNCIYNGLFNSFLKEAVSYPNYVALFGIKANKVDRFMGQEMILRFLSLTFNQEEYNGHLSIFLNEFMDTLKDVNETDILIYKQIFERTIDLIYTKIFNSAVVKMNKATIEAVFVGVAKNIEHLETLTNEELNEKYMLLKEDELFSIDSLKQGTSHKDKVNGRLNKAIEIFG